jgi:uncharacterized protein (TIGR00725 family)
MFIAVIGGSKCSSGVALLAEKVGTELAKRKVGLVCGGLTGVMEAACKGARSENGLTVGILPGDDRRDANAYVQIPIVTGLGYARDSIVVRSAQAVIAIDGEYGTLSEIAYAVQYGIPVIGLNTWSLCKDGEFEDTIIVAENAADAVEKAIAAANKGGVDDSSY